jgi:MoaA/NifB/PqqE/SkfB family radical SAM enzyme
MSKLILDGHKLLWHKDRVRAWLNGERIAPITIDCALTRRCSYRCVYCYGQLQENEPTTMTREHALNFLKDAAEIGVKAISFVSDGESTCVPFLDEAIVYGKEQGLDMALGTNGYRLNDGNLEQILPALTYLRFNISAGEPERYAKIHGCTVKCYNKVINTIKKCVDIKRTKNLDVTIGLQMVFMPQFADQVMPLSILGKNLGVDYLVIKHCSDDEDGSLGVKYGDYMKLEYLLKEAEAQSTENYLVKAKWSKIKSEGKRAYSRCFGPPFIMQFSGSGLVAPCGMLFNSKYHKYHIGNITEKRFKEIWESNRYWEVLKLISSEEFDAKTMCGTLCLQHKVNEFLDEVKHNPSVLDVEPGNPPMHVNFI